MSTSAMPVPREHGAWGLLLQPFLAAAVLAGVGTWLLIPALGLALSGFLLREPLTVLARQRWVWRAPNPQSAPAARWLLAEALFAAACLGLLLIWRAALPLAFLTLLGAVMTGLAVWMTIRNQQRSILLQLASAAGLGSTALLAAHAATGGTPTWAWQLWAVLTLHGALSVLTVRARLTLRAGGKVARPYAAPLLSLLVIPLLPAVAIPIGFSAMVNMIELTRPRRPGALQEPLRRVGFRALAVSLLHTCATIAVLWR